MADASDAAQAEARAKLAQKFAGSATGRIGGKGTVRRKRKTVHKVAAQDDKKLQATLKRLGVNNIPGIEEVNLFKDDGMIIHFENPKVQASIPANTYVISGTSETKSVTELLPGILTQMGQAGVKQLAETLQKTKGAGGADAGLGGAGDDDDEMPELETGDFDAGN